MKILIFFICEKYFVSLSTENWIKIIKKVYKSKLCRHRQRLFSLLWMCAVRTNPQLRKVVEKHKMKFMTFILRFLRFIFEKMCSFLFGDLASVKMWKMIKSMQLKPFSSKQASNSFIISAFLRLKKMCTCSEDKDWRLCSEFRRAFYYKVRICSFVLI